MVWADVENLKRADSFQAGTFETFEKIINQITSFWFYGALQFLCLLLQSSVNDDVIRFSFDDERTRYLQS